MESFAYPLADLVRKKLGLEQGWFIDLLSDYPRLTLASIGLITGAIIYLCVR